MSTCDFHWHDDLAKENEVLKLQVREQAERADQNYKNCKEFEGHWINAAGERDAARLQINELQKIVDAAVELVEWHGAGAVKSERYDRLFSLAGNYHLKAAEKPKNEVKYNPHDHAYGICNPETCPGCIALKRKDEGRTVEVEIVSREKGKPKPVGCPNCGRVHGAEVMGCGF